MLPDRVSNPGPLTYESGALPIALRGPANFYKVIRGQIQTFVILALRKTSVKGLKEFQFVMSLKN